MKARFNAMIYFIMLLLLASCEKNNFNANTADNQIVVQAEITNADSVFIPVAQTVAVGSGNIIKFSKPATSKVTLTDSLGSIITAHENFSPIFQNNPFAIFTSPYKIIGNNKYTLYVESPNCQPVTATTIVPAPISFARIKTSSTIIQNKLILSANIKFKDDKKVNNYYIIEVLKQRVKIGKHFFYNGTKYDLSIPADSILYSKVSATNNIKIIRDTIPLKYYVLQDIYTNDINTDNAKISSLEIPYQRILISDTSFNGLTYETVVNIDKKNFVQNNIEKQGRILVRLKSVPKDFYVYLFDYERYFTLFGSIPNNQLINLHSNIKDGLGVFGSSYQKQWVFYFEPLN